MKSLLVKAVLLLTLTSTLNSFTAKPGGEGFEVLLDGKVVLQRYGNDLQTVKSISLDKKNTDGILTIRYYHCGRTGKNRTVTVRDASDKLLKTFRFADVAKPVSDMSIGVKELLGLKTQGSLKIFYSSSELPAGRQLVRISPASSLAAR